ncbi:putative metal-dependent hydrolase YcfH [Sideroxyarcus emersonii]|uniref:Metal-dependent hydrolase YcfH n=1 Tax=Sideroxyarcus emersonii TaxID=2764705 RepID=A0AAN2BYW8_9PROT|nr:TatD family hydrolase [Sideroxyarcus emersonii]BCK87594.1 putative metal-dependent hydrolase YcfH [Sideroxyarcus emersonii]
MFIDSHCHLNFPDLAGQLESIFANMRDNQVSHALCVSVDLPSFPQVLELAHSHDNLYASVGVHPDYELEVEPTQAELVRLAQHPKVVAIGETGLDYYRLTGNLEWQRERFRTHIRAARECGKPLIIHTRSAAQDTLRIMAEENAGSVGGVMHCFTENLEVANAAIDLGFFISFSGILTFKNATIIKGVAQSIPLDRMLIETDSPYLAPTPHRGKTNQPAYVKHVAEEIARLRNITVDEVGLATTRNFKRLFLNQL